MWLVIVLAVLAVAVLIAAKGSVSS